MYSCAILKIIMQWILQISFAIFICSHVLIAHEILYPPDESCGGGLVYHPSDDNWTTLICDCWGADDQIYDPSTKLCYNPYTRGPCLPGYYFILPDGKDNAECVENPCVEDSVVPFDGGCYKIRNFDSEPPCKKNVTYLSVESKTFELKCMKIWLGPQGYFHHPIYGGIINAPVKECRRGSRRIYSGKCKRELQ